ncbi:hypothetical protein PAMP_014744 [Pampus punctatissimus]
MITRVVPATWREGSSVQQNSAQDSKKSRKMVLDSMQPQDCMESWSSMLYICSDEKQLTADDTSDTTLVKNKMKATFQLRQKVVPDSDTASTVLDLIPRFLDTPDLEHPACVTVSTSSSGQTRQFIIVLCAEKKVKSVTSQ